jgi:hypothetical protein
LISKLSRLETFCSSFEAFFNHHKECVATLGCSELIALGSLHGVQRHDEGIADLHLIAYFEMLLLRRASAISSGSRRSAIRIPRRRTPGSLAPEPSARRWRRGQ